MKKNKCFVMGAAALALLLAFGITLAACNGKTAQAQSSSGGDPAAGAAKGAAKDAAGAVKGGGQPAAASDFVYELNEAGDGVVITGIQDDHKFGAHLVVPVEIEGFPVVVFLAGYSDIGAKSRNQPPLVSVVFPDSIRFLGTGGYNLGDKWNEVPSEYNNEFRLVRLNAGGWASFGGSKSLTSIVFPKNLRVIPEGFLSDCPNLTPEGITWPETLEIIGVGAFRGHSFTELVIPDGVKVIGEAAFAGGWPGSRVEKNDTLTSLTIPDSIEEIGAEAFRYLEALTTVKMPSHPIKYYPTDTAVSFWPFADCPKLGIAAQMVIADTGYPDF
jgi:hypothetical protein